MKCNPMVLSVLSLALLAAVGCGDDTTSGPQAPQVVEVSIRPGSSVPGCEDTGDCYSPSRVTLRSVDTLVWSNDDTSAHTITSGTPQDGPTGHFDSSLIMSGAEYRLELDSPGTYPYFCMVHPWMKGTVVVE